MVSGLNYIEECIRGNTIVQPDDPGSQIVINFVNMVGEDYPHADTQTTQADDRAESRWGLDHILS